jgi:hypothetical protein
MLKKDGVLTIHDISPTIDQERVRICRDRVACGWQ